MVEEFGDVDVAVCVNRDRGGGAEFGFHGRATIAAESALAGPGHGSNDTVGRDFADAMVGGVSDKQVASCICHEMVRKVDLRFKRGSSITTEPAHTSARDMPGNSIGADPENLGVPATQDVKIIIEIGGNAVSVGKVGLVCRAIPVLCVGAIRINGAGVNILNILESTGR